jgi:predicted alpha/beta superfamily hydrolase
MKKRTVYASRLLTQMGMAALILLFVSCKKETFESGTTKEFTLVSAAYGASYDIKVGLPTNYDASTGKYATIYVLDGKENFEFVANRCKEIAAEQRTDNVIVVSIGYGRDRSIDYTPTKTSETTGGADEFLNFIETQLVPKIEHDYRADSSRSGRVILGHSYGGLFGGYAFTVNNKLFGNYILLSPSFWFDNLLALNLEATNRASNKGRSQLVFMGIGEAENAGRMQAPFEAFNHALQGNYPGIKLGINRERNLDHKGSRNTNIEKGLQFYFKNR